MCISYRFESAFPIDHELLESMDYVLLFLEYLPDSLLSNMEKKLGKCLLNPECWNKYICIIEFRIWFNEIFLSSAKTKIDHVHVSFPLWCHSKLTMFL